MTKNTFKDKVLALVFAMTILSGFLLVYWVSYEFDQNTEEVLLYSSDSTAKFPVLIYDDVPSPYWDVFGTGYYGRLGATDYWNFSKVPVYLGNNTYSIAINGTSTMDLTFSRYVFELPNLNNWVVSRMEINQTKNLDADLRETWRFYSAVNDGVFSGLQQPVVIYDSSSLGTNPTIYNNKTVNLTLQKSIELIDEAENGEQNLFVIEILDRDNDGLGAWAHNVKIEIYGFQSATYNIEQQLSLVLIISAVANIGIGTYALDNVDFGKISKDLKKYRRK